MTSDGRVFQTINFGRNAIKNHENSSLYLRQIIIEYPSIKYPFVSLIRGIIVRKECSLNSLSREPQISFFPTTSSSSSWGTQKNSQDKKYNLSRGVLGHPQGSTGYLEGCG